MAQSLIEQVALHPYLYPNARCVTGLVGEVVLLLSFRCLCCCREQWAHCFAFSLVDHATVHTVKKYAVQGSTGTHVNSLAVYGLVTCSTQNVVFGY
jgi:hypothetical protein